MWLIIMNEKFSSPSRPNPQMYSRRMMDLYYDPMVINVYHRFVWQVSNRLLCQQYADNVGERHLDLGPGTGYFLAKLPTTTPLREVHLLDLNPGPLDRTIARIGKRFDPIHRHEADALAPWPLADDSVDSVGSNMMIHCLPRESIPAKAVIFEQAARVLRSGGRFFGCTILGAGTKPNALARRALKVSNGFDNTFFNLNDHPDDLRTELEKHFDDVHVSVHGCTGVWTATAR
ncbi:MAG: class I SAM-dependent methyltransferase [Nocardiopsaceae bacterium]|nr:class I SAM-dependent methyltransferase [Nocardiopsaceae bacterium]